MTRRSIQDGLVAVLVGRWAAAFSLLLLSLMLSGTALALDRPTIEAVQGDLIHGRADDGISRLQPALAGDPRDADAHNLLCRIFFAEQRWDEAVHECEQAARLVPGSSSFHMWLGRAYGEKASRVSFLQAYKMSQKVRGEFETAVSLDPGNAAALADLGEFYTEAPSIVGGGLDKAEDAARRMEALDEARAHELRGRIADQRKDYATTEREFQAAIRAAGKPAGNWTVLASFYRRQQRWDDMMSAIHSAIAADKDHGFACVYAATVLIKANREPMLAEHLLESYFTSTGQSEDMPVFVAHARLGRLLDQQGDKAGAQREFQAAHALARDYRNN